MTTRLQSDHWVTAMRLQNDHCVTDTVTTGGIWRPDTRRHTRKQTQLNFIDMAGSPIIIEQVRCDEDRDCMEPKNPWD